MRTRRRKIRYAVLALLSATFAALIAWAWYDSTLGRRYLQYQRLSYHSGSGIFSLAWHPPLPPKHERWAFRLDLPPPGMPSMKVRWFSPSSSRVTFADPQVAVSSPMMIWWFFVPGILLLAWSVWNLARRPFPIGACQTCGYDLTGNVTGVCPECTAPAAAAAQPAPLTSPTPSL